DIVAGPMTHRPPVDGHLAQRKQFAGVLDVCEVLHFEGNVMHLDLLTTEEVNGVMVWVASQENKIVFDPVRYAEAQHPAVEIGHPPRVLPHTGDGSRLKRPAAQHLMVEAQVFQSVKDPTRGPNRIFKGKIFPFPGEASAPYPAFYAGCQYPPSHVRKVRL